MAVSQRKRRTPRDDGAAESHSRPPHIKNSSAPTENTNRISSDTAMEVTTFDVGAYRDRARVARGGRDRACLWRVWPARHRGSVCLHVFLDVPCDEAAASCGLASPTSVRAHPAAARLH